MKTDRETTTTPEALRRALSEECVGVYGYGRTGRAVVRALRTHTRRLIVFEDAPGETEPPPEGVEWVPKPGRLPESLERLIVSPGVPWNHELLRRARDRDCPVWAEVELAFRLCEGRIWAVTGTNAKSTCAELAGCLLRASDRPGSVRVCGNRGRPFVEAAAEGTASEYVVEISTFQVEGMEAFRPDATLLTNLGDDHRDRHGTLKRYHDLKWELVQRTDPDGHAALYQGDERIRRRARTLEDLEVRWFRREEVPGRSCRWSGIGLRLGETTVDREKLPFSLQLFPENIMAAIAWVGQGVTPGEVARGLAEFEPLPHRARRLGLGNGARVIEDSKGTNPHAVRALIQRLEGPLRLVLGGGGKGTDFSGLISYLTERDLRELVLAGEDPTVDDIAGECRERGIAHRLVSDWETAVKECVEKTRADETLVLSPGGSSFDAFEDYRRRGEAFERWVREADPA